MSLNVWLEFDDDTNMLIATDGNSEYYKWTYSDFEEHLNESITPSMYQFMAGHVYKNIENACLWMIEAGNYGGYDDCEIAVNAYYDLPALERKKMHDQELLNLQAEYARAEDKEMAAINWMLDDTPFDPASPIYVEVCQYVRGLVEKFKAKRERLEREIHEEEQWRGGWEEDMDTDPMYDHADEI
jgi:hypothetical protein